jgi:hypothetical protein
MTHIYPRSYKNDDNDLNLFALENGMIIEIPKTRNTIHDPCHLTLN